MITATQLLWAFLLDLFIGDPAWLPHPVRLLGKGISRMEGLLRSRFKGNEEKKAGVILVIAVVFPAAAIAFLLGKVLFSFYNSYFEAMGLCLYIFLMSTTIALHGLVSSAQLVVRMVRAGDLAGARQGLAMIVGRDTEDLEPDGIFRAVIETVAENLSDGVIAPLLYLTVGGLPLAIAYKAVNTLDSMVGYKNEKYIRFGWAAARLDDLANYVPARLTGLLITAGAFVYFLVKSPNRALAVAGNSFATLIRDGRKHTSPNSGMPEAAMAGALGVRLGGPSTYGGAVVKKPYIGDEEGHDYFTACGQTISIAVISSFIAVALFVLALNIIGGLT